jgi:hypothetical protein
MARLGTRSLLLQPRGLFVVTGAAHGCRRFPPAVDGLVDPPQLRVGVAEVAQGLALGGAVPGTAGRGQLGLMNGKQVIEVAQHHLQSASVGPRSGPH